MNRSRCRVGAHTQSDRKAGAAVGEFLDDGDIGERVRAGLAQLGGKGIPVQIQLRHLRDLIAREGLDLAPFVCVGFHMPFGESMRGLPDQSLARRGG